MTSSTLSRIYYPEAGDVVRAIQEGTITEQVGGSVIVTWANGEKDQLTFAQFALSFEVVSADAGARTWQFASVFQ